jgi:hypothetical protein
MTNVSGNAALVHSRIVGDRPVTLVGVTGYNNRGTDCFIQVHESATVPANGAVPMFSFQAYANLQYAHEIPGGGVGLSKCVIVASSTLATLTITTGTNATDKVTIQALTV